MNKTISWVVVLAGIWLIISPWILQFSSVASAMWNSIILGLIIIIIGLLGIFGKGSKQESSPEV